jgi:hypothetical protein
MKNISAIGAALLLALAANTTNAAVSVYLLNVDLFGNATTSSKTGAAAVGGPGDFWNSYTRDDGFGGWRTFAHLSNAQLANGTVTSVGMDFNNFPGFWASGSPDPMYDGYCYPFPFTGPAWITITGLPTGLYDVYCYGADGSFEVVSGSVHYGPESNHDNAAGNPPVWTERIQYSRFENVSVSGGNSMVLNVLPASDGTALIAGFQIVAVPEPGTGALFTFGILGGVAMKRIRRTRGS